MPRSWARKPAQFSAAYMNLYMPPKKRHVFLFRIWSRFRAQIPAGFNQYSKNARAVILAGFRAQILCRIPDPDSGHDSAPRIWVGFRVQNLGRIMNSPPQIWAGMPALIQGKRVEEAFDESLVKFQILELCDVAVLSPTEQHCNASRPTLGSVSERAMWSKRINTALLFGVRSRVSILLGTQCPATHAEPAWN